MLIVVILKARRLEQVVIGKGVVVTHISWYFMKL